MAHIYYLGNNDNIDVAVEESTTQTTPKDRFGKTLAIIFGVMVALLVVFAILSASALLRQNGETTVVSQLVNEDGEFQFKGWEMTPDLEAAIENGDVSLKGINVIEKGGDITFEGGDFNKITVVNYETVIEQNTSPKLYSDEYWAKLCREGKNTYVLRTLGLSTEAEKEGAE